MPTTREKPYAHDAISDQLEAILERALRAYHRDELHGGASWRAERTLDEDLTPVAREAFQQADDMPSDSDVLHVLSAETMHLLGEGYHVIALVEPARRFVMKYAKQSKAAPPLAPPAEQSPVEEWAHDHGVRLDGSLHPAIWQHIRSFEAYGPLAVPSRVYIADSALQRLSADERRTLERFRSIGIVRSLGSTPRLLRIRYPDDFAPEKRSPDGVTISVVVLQALVTPLALAIERSLRAGDVEAARDLTSRYEEFTQRLWRCGVSHLDLSILNIGIVGSGETERLQIFDPHMGEIDIAAGAREVLDPLTIRPSGVRPVDNVLRSARDGSRWALWRVQQDVTASDDAPPEGAEGAAAVVREFHAASEGVEHGQGAFGLERFDQMWQQRPTHSVNTVMHAQLWTLLRHPLGELLRSTLNRTAPQTVYDRSLLVQAMHDSRPLPQFRAALKVYQNRPLLLVANVADDAPGLAKHWGRLQLPAELDVQHDPAIHYHLRDLLTGEMYVRAGSELAERGFVLGLAPYELHALLLEDVVVEDLAVERALTLQRDISEFLKDCTKRVGVVGDVHGELQALKGILEALGFLDPVGHWSAHDGTLVLTGDVGHGRHLQEVFDFIRALASEAHRVGGRIVWTLGNHDLYADGEGGQGGEASVGYRLWPTIREAALHPERHPGLVVQAAYFDHGKVFVHGGILPPIVELAKRDRGGDDAATVASYVNDVLRQTLVERERIMARDLPHEIFHTGTSHARERRVPGEIGYEPAGVFTPDLRELDHYRYHATLLPQVVGHTASRRGEIRYSPGSWLRRDYIAIDVGRQHGTGNGGLLLTDFGWAAVTPGGPAQLVEVAPLFVELARESASAERFEEPGETSVQRMLHTYFQVAKPERKTFGAEQTLFANLSPAQVVAIEGFLAAIRQNRRSVVVTDLDDMLTAFSGGDLAGTTVEVLADYLAAGGVLVFISDMSFEWFYARFLRPLIVELGARSRLLANVLLILCGGAKTFAFYDGAYQLIAGARPDRTGAFDQLVALSKERRVPGISTLEPQGAVYLGNSFSQRGIDDAMARRVGVVINVGDAMLETTDKPLINLHRGYLRTIEVIDAATAALNDSGGAALPECPAEVGDTALWTFERPHFPPRHRLRVRVGGSGFVHAGVISANDAWEPVYDVPLVPLPNGGYEAVLPAGINVFTFFWTEAPWTRGLPGHWERGRSGPRVFTAQTD